MNKNISKLHLDLLDKKRQELLQKLIPYVANFVLSGGTALSLQLGHRKSFDFDFFSSLMIPKKLLEKLSKTIRIKNVAVDTSDELTFFTENNIKVTFLYYPFKTRLKPIKAINGLWLFSVKEIALQKAYTIGRRGEYRDYFDLYTMLTKGFINLNKLISETKNVYGALFDEKLFLEQLVYFGDISNFEIIPVTKASLPKPDEIKRYLEGLVKAYLF
ncbi:hypothetical protein A3F00_02215 [Candidatus Daviesbacteria bacterium RIFCSPHIGHO2_12_FULL_37_11]|uniref:Nucleotidyl transferase AbiEii/AbiGii toxin family protein n=1 Tax=Candidatus Daviesbacteria bacterium RIFCSPHIGHO2_12_FULL_37_11 TaxID=1797777 RepID=A0A1F5KCL6_9BACT|nr:MAG: hypothetical protein A3F00_02215 [Candidatus Daviesbacteria bacterium RIFCSPHIGHO2_12_FULL_37_11]